MIFNKMKNSNLHRMREITQEPLLTLPESATRCDCHIRSTSPPPFLFFPSSALNQILNTSLDNVFKNLFSGFTEFLKDALAWKI